jgi:hypothetical protein
MRRTVGGIDPRRHLRERGAQGRSVSAGAPSGTAPAGDASSTARDVGSIGAAGTGIGAGLATIIAGTCCVSPILSPIIVGVLGASGAVWAAGLNPYAWWILGGAAVPLAGGFWSVYRRRAACAIGEERLRRRTLDGVARISLWVGAAFWAAAVLIRIIVPT